MEYVCAVFGSKSLDLSVWLRMANYFGLAGACTLHTFLDIFVSMCICAACLQHNACIYALHTHFDFYIALCLICLMMSTILCILFSFKSRIAQRKQIGSAKAKIKVRSEPTHKMNMKIYSMNVHQEEIITYEEKNCYLLSHANTHTQIEMTKKKKEECHVLISTTNPNK